MTPQQQLEKLLPKIKRDLLNNITPRKIHILDLVRQYNLPDECSTPLATRLSACTTLSVKVWATNGSGPFHYIIERY